MFAPKTRVSAPNGICSMKGRIAGLCPKKRLKTKTNGMTLKLDGESKPFGIHIVKRRNWINGLKGIMPSKSLKQKQKTRINKLMRTKKKSSNRKTQSLTRTKMTTKKKC